eukprot:TRINITY_DN5300_c0_g2_i2.p1 TRINITY_DN5300_c0_g2~~TRINITY_DN5300_c0_g2_i2.p1  ORF type:complete len:343 (-),score=65.23 TRINITY_DN5300_c0_g2_i2:8-1036(-)
MANPACLVIGWNPAYQKVLSFTELQKGGVNRATSLHKDVGGKGQQVAKALHFYRESTPIFLAQFLGGQTGEWIQQFLSTLGFQQLTVHVTSETRTCTTLLAKGMFFSFFCFFSFHLWFGVFDFSFFFCNVDLLDETTEIIDPSDPVTPEEVEKMEQLISEHIEKVSAIIISGTYPPGVPASGYASVVLKKKEGTFVLLDGYKGVDETLATGKVDVLKINAHELKALTLTETIQDGANALFSKYTLPWVAITDGKDSAALLGNDGSYFRYSIPVLENVVNPIGAGDTVSAVMTAHVMEGMPIHEAFRHGLAAASASCLELTGAKFSLENLHALLSQIEGKEVK